MALFFKALSVSPSLALIKQLPLAPMPVDGPRSTVRDPSELYPLNRSRWGWPPTCQLWGCRDGKCPDAGCCKKLVEVSDKKTEHVPTMLRRRLEVPSKYLNEPTNEDRRWVAALCCVSTFVFPREPIDMMGADGEPPRHYSVHNELRRVKDPECDPNALYNCSFAPLAKAVLVGTCRLSSK